MTQEATQSRAQDAIVAIPSSSTSAAPSAQPVPVELAANAASTPAPPPPSSVKTFFSDIIGDKYVW